MKTMMVDSIVDVQNEGMYDERESFVLYQVSSPKICRSSCATFGSWASGSRWIDITHSFSSQSSPYFEFLLLTLVVWFSSHHSSGSE